ncbi:similar to Saccharomyces cerevisiae YFL008W SMC1 Subunit of the multiprotein cohesin complex, essential protein involved in chromosome segregation and in double-strand DNA break repair [Maudiozyma barnettii]|uniref:Structural maintenance of chromosomes protein n=1 Tax=Maudiozyma barnettii TaxID=61262 RepID=A0A8H2ZHT8_9SACH|nr:cohesin subunit SMC1 [Kazachstania barnettii]CAB4252444.1 similar to Saccharomyces cerevisiae YFL008W SMC1 Subunit of the multiprotein cohesin complex, essential protein involved in chromosome segregation and in double-strand DNA break repair [Kazachstania barnettii]CAD1779179.1 similar to Saccharomyces cerevisiae YFL008W SMC1 Subunit of the multiprotein cohesin complex, essential protein involved in chromosome segregation and in double-strand DNA break repair [Kazachstania barnettii]
MGRLLGLELHNFKSYKGTTKVGFGESNFTSIIGPNGSGKSNMMDAISFVLGVRSSHLRSHQLKDLVYRGPLQENSMDSLDDDQEDNENAYVCAFYKKDDSIVRLQRNISIHGDSDYRIDDQIVSYKEYSKWLENENILVKAKNFLVFQGDVEQVASQSPMDLSKLIEEVSGSNQYKTEYESLKDEVNILGKATTDATKNSKRAENELKTLEQGINQNNEYKDNVKQKKVLQKHFALWQLYQLEQTRQSFKTAIKKSNEKINQLQKKMKDEERSLIRSQKLVSRDATSITKNKSTLEYIQRDHEKLISDLKLVHLPQQTTKKRIDSIEQRIATFQKDIERQKSYIERYEKQLKVTTKTKSTFQEEIKENNKNQTQYQLSKEDLIEYEKLNGKYLAQGGAPLEETLALLENDKEEITIELNRFENVLETTREKINNELQINLEDKKLQLEALTSSLNDKNAQHTERVNGLKDLQSQIESNSNKEYDLNYKLRETLVRIDDLSANQRESLKEKKTRENVTTLKRFFPGVKGLVHDLCHPKKDKYALAVSTVLGRNFDSIIVDSSATAQECISYLKKQRTGAASFIPLDTIESEIASLPVSGGGSGYILAINAMEYEPQYERAIQYVCSNTIICDTLDIAKSLKWEQGINSKLVTLDGSYIHRAGLMTGGTSKNQNNRWDKEEYQSLMTSKDKLLMEIEDLTASTLSASLKARDLESVISMLNSEIANIRINLTQTNRVIDDMKVELTNQNDLIEREYLPKIVSLKEKIQELENIINSKTQEKEMLQDTIYKVLTDKVGFTIKDYENHSGELMRKQNKELNQLQKEILTVENKLQFEVERLATTEKRFEKAQTDLQKTKAELKSLQDDETHAHSKITKNETKIQEQNEEISNLQESLIAKQRELAIAEDRVTDLESQIETQTRHIDEINGDGEKIELERVGILQNCKISGIEIPVLSATDLADLPIAQIDDTTLDISQKLDIDYDDLPKKYKENKGQSTRSEFISKIKNAEEKLSVLQPNARASERHDDAMERFREINQERTDLKEKENSAMKRFREVKSARKNLFEKAFDHVSEHLSAIYRELTRNPNSSMELSGGNASLTLENEDEPFNGGIRYHATPPLKRFKDMEYLSGGEKTVAALALLFAINSYHPSPFFVLDEVDAALDITNVERIAMYIRRHGNPDLQFIVISLKSSMFEKSDALVGVFRQPDENTSKAVTLDLRNYAD